MSEKAIDIHLKHLRESLHEIRNVMPSNETILEIQTDLSHIAKTMDKLSEKMEKMDDFAAKTREITAVNDSRITNHTMAFGLVASVILPLAVGMMYQIIK